MRSWNTYTTAACAAVLLLGALGLRVRTGALSPAACAVVLASAAGIAAFVRKRPENRRVRHAALSGALTRFRAMARSLLHHIAARRGQQRWALMLAALALDAAVLFWGESDAGAVRHIGPVRAAFWSTLLAGAFAARCATEEVARGETLAAPAALALHMALLLRQPDIFAVFTQCVCLLCIPALPRVAGSGRSTAFALAGTGFLSITAAAATLLSPFRANRLAAWANPDLSPAGAGFHLLRLRRAFHEAGAWGVPRGILDGSIAGIPGAAGRNGMAFMALWLGNVAAVVIGAALLALLAALFAAIPLKGHSRSPLLFGIWLPLACWQAAALSGAFGLLPPGDYVGVAFVESWQSGLAVLALWGGIAFSRKAPPPECAFSRRQTFGSSHHTGRRAGARPKRRLIPPR